MSDEMPGLVPKIQERCRGIAYENKTGPSHRARCQRAAVRPVPSSSPALFGVEITEALQPLGTALRPFADGMLALAHAEAVTSNLTLISDTTGTETSRRGARIAEATSAALLSPAEPKPVQLRLKIAAKLPLAPGAALSSARLSFADVVAEIVALPLTATEKAEAVRRLPAVRSQ